MTDVPSTPARRTRRRGQRPDTTPPTPTSTRTQNYSVSAGPDLHPCTCTHTLHMQFIYTLHSTVSCTSRSDWELTRFFILRKNFLLQGSLSILYRPFGWEHCCCFIYLLFHVSHSPRGPNHLFSCLCNSSVCAQQLIPLATSVALTKTSTTPKPTMRLIISFFFKLL